jgi:hypothetical protein
LKWNGTRYHTAVDARQGPGDTRLSSIQRVFASDVRAPTRNASHQPADLRLHQPSAAIDAGQPLPGLNDGFAGTAPDLCAYEFGEALPHYGPRTLATK